ncbi:MAG: hypothetical protein COU29_01350 [Candidatus Magasanikbacteria bacterium CG10_big_fil_rev_8_21_14_0_10_36_32]|uniref:Uncharacterized protein n=1 Tax=Candidatus Magasanikbacteria bacterium CG10_big_fil_rev_8_21_14_0_10_36_32 TaxID=1974646 RepID=A0A2M6W6L5_9BACT|nr:MAG: hypothetical protein COU29_01350 [Candidatus Magasanikbacteria bacterium CG10_big_fil_rev_8_21_14_0_10_36_32]
MAVKKYSRPASRDSSWQERRAGAFSKVGEGLVDIAYEKRLKINDRIKLSGLKPKMVYRVKIGDDLRVFIYQVTKIDKQEGIVYLKNEKGTVRKVGVFDKIFGSKKIKK